MSIDKISALAKTALFAGLEEKDLRAVADRAVEQRLASGEILFVAGDEARGLYVIAEGAVRAYRESLDGREQVIHVERAGATIAEVPMFDDGDYPSTVAADEDSIILFVDKRDFRNLCMSRPIIALAALKILATRLRRCAALVEDLSLHEVDERLARLLLSEARSRGRRTEEGIALDLILSNQQIAARIGTVREVVSRALSRLQQNELIAVSGRRVTITDEEALKAFVGD
jgi:CRP/FNR family transcriptional regulator